MQSGLYDKLNEKDWIESSIVGHISTKYGDIKVLSHQMETKERVMNFLARQGVNRNNYKVTPGLYALGRPSAESDVYVTSNYKVSLDALRCFAPVNSWILILDTHGINVWCAAGKGTFGTAEVVRLIKKCRLSELVSHRKVILPQLGAPGVSAFEVKKLTGFAVTYGPVEAKDIQTFVTNGYKASKEMRRVGFNLKDRLMLTPLEFFQSMRFSLLLMVLILLIGLLGPYTLSDGVWIWHVVVWAVSLSLVGAVVFPLCLPLLKGNMFSRRAMPLTLVWGVTFVLLQLRTGYGTLEGVGLLLAGAGMIELFALNFTGATPITSYSETKVETLRALPYIVALIVVGCIVFGLSVWQVIA